MIPASVEEKKAFFKNHKPPKEKKEKEEEKPKEQKLLNNFYSIENPISTCIGEIGEFDPKPEAFPNHPSVGLYGKRRTGKSYTLRCLLYNCFRHVPFGAFHTFDFF